MTTVSENTNYDLGKALDAAILMKAAYSSGTGLRGELLRTGWAPLVSQHAGIVLDVGGGMAAPAVVGSSTLNAYAFAATKMQGDTKQYAISFRGTDNLTDWLNNVGHYGFTEYYKSVRQVMEEALWQAAKDQAAGQKVEILVTGHSLGGAAAQAALLDLLSPRGQGVWSDPQAPLGEFDRLKVNFEGDSFTYNPASLASVTHAYTFGAPSI
jgi:hypothetical protein